LPYQSIRLDSPKEYDPLTRERRRRRRKLIRTMSTCAAELRSRHLAWTGAIRPTGQAGSPEQATNLALKLAMQDLREVLRRGFSTDDNEPQSL
jgi:hypothetical protein